MLLMHYSSSFSDAVDMDTSLHDKLRFYHKYNFLLNQPLSCHCHAFVIFLYQTWSTLHYFCCYWECVHAWHCLPVTHQCSTLSPCLAMAQKTHKFGSMLYNLFGLYVPRHSFLCSSANRTSIMDRFTGPYQCTD